MLVAEPALELRFDPQASLFPCSMYAFDDHDLISVHVLVPMHAAGVHYFRSSLPGCAMGVGSPPKGEAQGI